MNVIVIVRSFALCNAKVLKSALKNHASFQYNLMFAPLIHGIESNVFARGEDNSIIEAEAEKNL